jgi:predicted ribosomally synthesized peptide with SipW-like signal peptide
MILLLALAILALSLGLGASYAWFTSRSDVDMKSGLYGDKNALATYGSLNLELKVDSHMLQYTNSNGVSIEGTPFPIGNGEALLAYPGADPGSIMRVDANGNVIDTPRHYVSILTYTLTNHSQSYALAMIPQSGVEMRDRYNAKGKVVKQAVGMGGNTITSLFVDQYVLLGADLTLSSSTGTPDYGSGFGGHYSNLENFVAEGPTWFKYDYGFGSSSYAADMWAYVNIDKLLAAGFDMETMAYDIDAKLATGYTVYDKSGVPYANNEMPLYKKVSEAVEIKPGDTQFPYNASIDPTVGRPANYIYTDYPGLNLNSDDDYNKLTDCMLFSIGGSDMEYPGIYFYMPPKGATTIVIKQILKIRSDGEADTDNLLQFSMYKMRLFSPDDGRYLSAYGIEPVEGAVKEHFNGLIGLDSPDEKLWNKLKTMFSLT